MKGHGAKFGRKKEAAIAALLTCRTTEEAANAVGVSVKTLLRWQRMSEFAAAYREAQRAALSKNNSRFLQATGPAASVIIRLMADQNEPAGVRLKAAECVFNRVDKVIQMEDLEERLANLEQAVEETKSK